jgi:hypothetical protein
MEEQVTSLLGREGTPGVAFHSGEKAESAHIDHPVMGASVDGQSLRYHVLGL